MTTLNLTVHGEQARLSAAAYENYDDLTGGGADTFVSALQGGRDLITDFEDDVDTLLITGLGGRGKVLNAANDVDGNVEFTFGSKHVLTVANITVAQLSDDLQV